MWGTGCAWRWQRQCMSTRDALERTRHVILAEAGSLLAVAGCLEGREPVGSDRLREGWLGDVMELIAVLEKPEPIMASR